MRLRLFRNLLLIFSLYFTPLVGQTYYWVGGSGNWNDPAHWSLNSGGSPVNKVPGSNTDVVFDDRSGEVPVISIVGKNASRSINFTTRKPIYVIGDVYSELAISGNFILNENTKFQTQSKLIFNSFTIDNVVNTGTDELNSDLNFESGGWKVLMVQTKGAVSVKNAGFELQDGWLKCRDFVTSANSELNLKNSTTIVDNLFFVSSSKINVSDYNLIAKKSDPLLFKAPPVFEDYTKVKIGDNNKPMACGITTAMALPTCPNLCNGTISFTFDAQCTTNPYFISFPAWPSGCTPTPPATAVNGPTTFSLGNICRCGIIYQVAISTATSIVNVYSFNFAMSDIGFSPVFSIQPTCAGFCNGQMSGFISGGTAPYTGTVSGTNQTFTANPAVNLSSLCATPPNYTVFMTDNNGCTASSTFTMDQPTPLTVGVTSSSIACFGDCTGSAGVTGNGGTPNYTVNWSTGTSSVIGSGGTSTLSSLCASVTPLSFTLTDSRGCIVSQSMAINQPTAPLAITASQTNASCGGTCNATASVNVTGGTPGYQYTWTPAPGGGQGTPVATSLCGTLGATSPNHTVTIMDLNGCVRTRTFTITEPTSLSLTPTFTNATCNGTCNGIALSGASGGTSPYTYTWVAPSTATIANTSSVTGLCGGFPAPLVYTIAVTDNSLCAISNTVGILQPQSFSLTVTTSSVTCNGLCTGAATANVSGGTAGYTYTWTAPTVTTGATPSISNLCANNYTVNIRDANNCPATTTFTITQPQPLLPNVTTQTITCSGLCNGAINSAPTGGTSGYSVSLATSTGTINGPPPFTGLCAGTYTVRVVDAAGCATTQVVVLNQPNTFTLSVTSSSISCFGQCNANLSGNISGGTPTYTFVWTTPSTTITSPAITNQCAGNYFLTVTDANGCNITSTLTITQPSSVTIGLTPNSPNCNGQTNGSVTSTVTGGTPGYTLSWNGAGPNGPTLSNIGAGTYTLTVTDIRGCITSATTTVVPTPSITITTTVIPITCSGMCNGQALATATGGSGTFTLSWMPAAQSGTATTATLCAGNQSLTVTDNKGCIGTAIVTVTAPTVLSAAVTGTAPSCNVCIGSATIAPAGGTPGGASPTGYTVTWSPAPGAGQGTNTPSLMCVGNYTAVVQDANGCTVTRTLAIPQTIILNITTNGTTLTCNGGCTGIANANANGGTPAYSYSWTNSTASVVSTASVATNLCADVYTVSVTDQVGCSNTGTISFANPPAITVTPTQTNAACSGTCNGAISAPASGGTPPYVYTWAPLGTGGNTPNVTNLCAGVYTLTVTDFNNCSSINTYTITQPNAITATFTPFSPSICSGTNGAITTTVTGGTPSYTYNWNPTSATTAVLSNLTAGSYSLTVIDAAGCTTTITTVLSDPTGPTLTVVSSSVTCNSSCNGSATVTALGTGPMTYTWSSSPSSTNIATALCQGTFAVSVTDQSVLCTTSQTFNIIEPPTFSMNATPLSPTCGGSLLCNGSVNSTAAGGTGPYSFTLTSLNSGSAPGPPPFLGLCGDSYTLIAVDNNNCNYSQTFTLTQPPAVTLTVNQTDVSCFGACNGSITIVATGGTAGYTYTWTSSPPFPATPLPTVVNLCPNTYTLNGLDGNNCPFTTTAQIIEPTLLTSSITSQNAVCSGSCSGSATLTTSGGTPNYTVTWTASASTSSVATGLCAGNYTATAVDANGCISAQGFTITQPAPVNVTLTPTNPLCNGSCNGSISSNVTGGNGAYTYSWIPSGITNSVATGLCASSYTLLVLDGNSCPGQAIAVLTNPPAMQPNISFTNASCGAVCNGSAISNPTNGVPAFTFTWTSTTFTSNLQNPAGMCADVYSVTVMDGNNCSVTQQFTLSVPPPLTITPSSAAAACGVFPCNGSITIAASGGTPTYSYSWSPAVSTTSVASNLCAGIYTVTVTDANTCSNTFQLPLSNSNGPSGATITSTNVLCNGQCNGAASVGTPVTGGTAPFSFSWITTPTWTPAPTPTTMPQTNLCANTYTAQITDANTCLLFVPVTIIEPPALIDNSVAGSPLCNGVCNGSISVSPTGGTAPYNFTWSTGATNTGTSSSITSLCTGAYSLTVTDGNLCTYTVGYTLPGLTSITANTASINNNCFASCAGVLNVVNLTGGTPGYTFNWSDPLGQSTQQATGLCNGNYYVVVTDAAGCFDTIRASIISPPAITMTSSVVQPTCGLCNGTATISALGGTAPYTYSWSSAGSGTLASNMCAGLYVISITDNLGCVQNINLPISNSNGITGEVITSANESCPGSCDGSATITAVGGTAPITYFWFNPVVANTSTLSAMCGGTTYFVQMQDAVGCIRTSSVTMNSNSDFTLSAFISQPSCTVSNGEIIVSVTGGTGPFNYAWSPVAPNSPTLSNIPAGTYTLVVIDMATGCEKTGIYNVSSVNAPVVSVLSSNATCNGSCNGSASFIVNAGSAGFTYTWSTGNSGSIPAIGGSSSEINLCGGSITFTVAGADGCRLTQSISITQPGAVALSLPIINTPDCNNDCNGAITLVPSGGSTPYTYSWSPGASTVNPATGLCAGPGASTIYSVTVTDLNGCFDTMAVNLINPQPLALTTSLTPASCNNVNDAAITTTVSGGIPTYSYTWTGPSAFTSTNSAILGLFPGTYSLHLEDFSGCQKDTTILVISTVTVIANAGNDSTFCLNSFFTLDGSSSVVSNLGSYSWYQLPSATPFSNLSSVAVTPAPGSSTFVLVIQESGCTDSDTISLTSNVPPTVDAGPDYTLTIYTSTVIGGSPTSPTGITYTWSPSFSLDNPNIANPTASNTVNTTYTVTVTDINGCSASDTMHVNIYPDIIIPNGFSPNSDGKNDTWIIDNIEQFPDCVVEVYNRWGELLFLSKGYVNKWDGKYNGKDLPVGTYYYVINLNHEFFPNPYTGPITIFR